MNQGPEVKGKALEEIRLVKGDLIKHGHHLTASYPDNVSDSRTAPFQAGQLVRPPPLPFPIFVYDVLRRR